MVESTNEDHLATYNLFRQQMIVQKQKSTTEGNDTVFLI